MKGKEKNVKWSLRVKKIDLIGVFDIALFNTLIGKKKQRMIYSSQGHKK